MRSQEDINDLELADEEIRNVTLAVMTRALPRRSLLRCRPENRTESIEGCSRVSKAAMPTRDCAAFAVACSTS